MTVTSLLELNIKPERLADAERIIDETLEATRAFAGNLGCVVSVDTDDPTHYVIVERWESLAADDAYRAFRATPEGANQLGEITSGRKLVRYTDV
jgi:heme oxygenase (mycobilin-producing)